MKPCHFVRCRDCPGGRALIPGCWGAALDDSNTLRNCTCKRDGEKAERMDLLERRVTALERRLARAEAAHHAVPGTVESPLSK